MIHFVTHISTSIERSQLPLLKTSLEKYFPGHKLHIFNQTLGPVAGEITCENIKGCGFGWTTRFLRHVLGEMGEGDLLIKIDPDTEIRGDPLEGLTLPEGSFFGQIKMVGCCDDVFFGAFQGFTYGAAKKILEIGHVFENEVGPQDVILRRIVEVYAEPFVALPNIDLWAKVRNLDLKVIHMAKRQKYG